MGYKWFIHYIDKCKKQTILKQITILKPQFQFRSCGKTSFSFGDFLETVLFLDLRDTLLFRLPAAAECMCVCACPHSDLLKMPSFPYYLLKWLNLVIHKENISYIGHSYKNNFINRRPKERQSNRWSELMRGYKTIFTNCERQGWNGGLTRTNICEEHSRVYSKFWFRLIHLFNSIPTPYVLFNTEFWFICKCLIVILIIFWMFRCILIALFYLSLIICLNTVVWFQVFLSNTHNL